MSNVHINSLFGTTTPAAKNCTLMNNPNSAMEIPKMVLSGFHVIVKVVLLRPFRQFYIKYPMSNMHVNSLFGTTTRRVQE